MMLDPEKKTSKYMINIFLVAENADPFDVSNAYVLNESTFLKSAKKSLYIFRRQS